MAQILVLLMLLIASPALFCSADDPSPFTVPKDVPQGEVAASTPRPQPRLRIHDAVSNFVKNPSQATWNGVVYAVEVGPPDSEDTICLLMARYHLARNRRDFPNSVALKKGVDLQRHSELLCAHVEAVFPKLALMDSPAMWDLIKIMSTQSFDDSIWYGLPVR